MSKLANKFLIRISVVLILVLSLSLLINTRFVEKYYLHAKKHQMNKIAHNILENKENLSAVIKEQEQKNKVVIVTTPKTDDIDAVNEQLRSAFLDKGLGLERYWLWEQDYETTVKEGRKLRIYNQSKMNYSLMVEYLYVKREIIGVAMIIPNLKEMLVIINWATVWIIASAVIVIIIILGIQVRRITRPIGEIGQLAEDISNQNFRQVQIYTNDEIEVLADRMNDMSISLKENRTQLVEKNRQMEALLGNVSHDLKTPITLIRAYASGIRDGIDDGTFVDTILKQSIRMEGMVQGLLELSRMQQREELIQMVNLTESLNKVISEHEIQIKEKGITIEAQLDENVVSETSEEAIDSLFMNLISNGVKYTKNQRILVKLRKTRSRGFYFEMENGVGENCQLEIEHIWEPFYVGEKSRNKELSGTGLGLSIVRAIAQKQGFTYGCFLREDQIRFYVKSKII